MKTLEYVFTSCCSQFLRFKLSNTFPLPLREVHLKIQQTGVLYSLYSLILGEISGSYNNKHGKTSDR